MKRKILVIGTSHSVAICKETVNQKNATHFLSGRWHDHMGEYYDADVFNLSYAGCTVQQQLSVVYNYFKLNPEIRYDLCVVEGRCVESTISTPDPQINWYDDIDTSDHSPRHEIYEPWTDEMVRESRGFTKFVKRYTPIGRMDAHSGDEVNPEYLTWFLNYNESYLHAMDTWFYNYSMMKFLENYCDRALWYSFSTGTRDPKNLSWELSWDLLKDNALFHKDEHFPHIEFSDMKPNWDKDKCLCGHLNQRGHKRLWEKVLKPRMEEIGLFK